MRAKTARVAREERGEEPRPHLASRGRDGRAGRARGASSPTSLALAWLAEPDGVPRRGLVRVRRSAIRCARPSCSPSPACTRRRRRRARRSTASGRHIAVAYGEGKLRGGEGRLQGRLIRMVGGHFTKMTVGKVIPFVASPIMAVQNGNAVAELGERAMRFYGG